MSSYKKYLSDKEVFICIDQDRLSGNINISGSLILSELYMIALIDNVFSEHHKSLIDAMLTEYRNNGHRLARTKHRQVAAVLQRNVDEIEKKLKDSNNELYTKLRYGIKQAVKIEKRCIEMKKEFDANRTRGNVVFVDDLNSINV